MEWLTRYFRLYNTNGPGGRDITRRMTTLINNIATTHSDSNHALSSNVITKVNSAKFELALYALSLDELEKARDLAESISNDGIEESLLREINEKHKLYALAIIRHYEILISPDRPQQQLSAIRIKLEEVVEEIKELYTRLSNITGLEPLRIMGNTAVASMKLYRDAADLYDLNPVLASALDMASIIRSGRSETSQNHQTSTIAQSAMLDALENFSGLGYLEAQYPSHVNIAFRTQGGVTDRGKSLGHLEQAMKILSNGSFLGNTNAAGWLRIEASTVAHELGQSDSMSSS